MAFTIVYVWEDLDAPEAEQKFGDHYSHEETLEKAIEETRLYIRSTLYRQKHKFDQGRVTIHKIWDATEYAKLHNRFGPHKKVDDLMRPVIGHHLQGDVHIIDSDTLIERINRELIKHNQPLPVVGLSQNQIDAAENVITAIANGKRTIVAELCARFGKTIWSGALVRELNSPLTIVCSYVLTVFTSFKKDLSSYEQFRDLVLADTSDEDYQEQINQGVISGKQVVAFLSMCSGTRRQEKIDYLFNYDLNGYGKLVFVDEADFGVHQIGQSQPLIDARNNNDVIILMTGTNGDRASSIWPVDHYHSVTYPELLMEKHKDRLVMQTS